MARISVEDCIGVVGSRFGLVHLAAERSRQLIRGSKRRVKSENKSIVTALREIAAEKVTVETEE